MRALRSSIYADMLGPPVSTVALEDGLRDTLESARLQLRQPGALVIHDIFETEDDLVVATAEAHRRQQANREQELHQATLYFWTVSRWGIVKEGGTLFMDQPAPLSREEIIVVFDQLREHPDHRDITIVSHDRHGRMVKMVNGKIEDA